MALKLSVSANKGGVGKTLISINLIGAIRKSFPSSRILAVDTDAQGNLTKSFRVKVGKEQNTIYDVFMGQAKVEETIVPTYDTQIDVLPANSDNNFLEFDKMEEFRDNILEWFASLVKKSKDNLKAISNVAGLKKILNKSIDPSSNYFNALEGYFDSVEDKYDFIIFDTPPELKQVTSSVLTISDVVIIPYEPDMNGVDGVVHLISRVNTLKEKFNPNLRIGGVLGNKVYNTNVHAKMINAMMKYTNRNGYHYFDTELPRSIKFADKLIRSGMPITMSFPDNPFAQHFYKLLDEMNRIGLLSAEGETLDIPHNLFKESEVEE
ncbi:MAG: AAA family ATPase [Lactococcus lactis]|jgi:chromosome partitioning protein|uniref:ParA family protein n=1 Tax=Enterococcus TaxID=1350 RepID=UPI000DF5CC5A|nr:AAA family ATPase [Enterococcus gilvus]AXG40782.1 ParA family protein [Enterococcus gilvus]MDN5980922.1 AAA family ATPase [Lactococcus lactis]MDN6233494.1 AAA family ATPase [Staphylococcus simulans]MDN6548514.1 AAA family ATPase [Lactococcus lactis]